MLAKDTNIKIVQENPKGATDGFNLDGILTELGSYGKYQLLLLLLLAFRDSFLSMCNFNYVFTAAEVNFRCSVPECESADNTFNASWISYALTNKTNTCFRMTPFEKVSFNNTVHNHQAMCSAENFAWNKTISCDKVVYEDYNSIVAEFDLGCQPWKTTLIGTVHNLGLVFSFLISGLISDRYGRKVVIVLTPLVVAVAGIIKSFSVNYYMLLVLEFLETALGYGNASMVLSLELVSQKQRVMFSCVSDILASIGGAFFGLIAWKVPYWRDMMRAIYAPLLIVVFYIFLIDEGVRWLLAHNKNDEAVRVLNKVAKINNIELSNKAKSMLSNIAAVKKANDEEGDRTSERLHLLSVLRSRTILLRVALIACCFICSTFLFNGTIINSTSVAGNKYINYSTLHLVSVPTRIITAFTLTKFGRKPPIFVSYVLCCIFFFASAFVSKAVWWASLLFYLAARMCSSYGMFSMYVVAMEVFPTTSRNSLTNIANTIGRIGTVLAPQAPLLDQYFSGLTSIVFGVVAIGAALLTLVLPETSQATLPDDVAAAEKIDNDGDGEHTYDGEHTKDTIHHCLSITQTKD